jgi:hypothetical protein
MSADRFMPAALYFDTTRAVIAGKYAYSGQSFTMKPQN